MKCSLYSLHVNLYSSHVSLRSSHVSLRSSHVSLRSSQVSLRSSHASLRSSHASLRSSHVSLRSSHVSLRSSHVSLYSLHVEVAASFSSTIPMVMAASVTIVKETPGEQAPTLTTDRTAESQIYILEADGDFIMQEEGEVKCAENMFTHHKHISSGTVCRASWNGFPWRAAAAQPYITKRSAERGTQWCKAPPLDSRAVEACSLEWPITLLRLLEHPHTVPADGAVGVEVEGHQAFHKPFILVLTTVPPHTDSLGVSTKTKAGLVTEDDPLPF
ncbi:hypothetical protein NFI96_019158 [Prochilodus magdalenae]|nr:hypothetical protein NFI96_019158 [Prochilodus magdalenae]